jgi:hypothetical protein
MSCQLDVSAIFPLERAAGIHLKVDKVGLRAGLVMAMKKRRNISCW